jgi:alanine racemase
MDKERCEIGVGLHPNSHVAPLTWAEVDLDALAHNYRELRRVTAPSAVMMAVVKADGYGHGAPQVARVALENGAELLAVARMGEAVQLREAGILAPILLFGHSLPSYVDILASKDIRAALNSLEGARSISAEAVRRKTSVKAHIKIDTGMGRLGLLADEIAIQKDSGEQFKRAIDDVLAITALPGIEVEGIFTHFANADSRDKGHATTQLSYFTKMLEKLETHAFRVRYRHAANSAAIIEMPGSHLDLVRPGIAQYGLWPSGEVDRQRIDLKPVMSIKSKVIHVKDVGADFAVSYGSTHVTPYPTRIATIPVGYADGYDRILSSNGHMLVKGVRAPIIGRVCMDLTMIDVGHVPDVCLEDDVVILGSQGDETISADEIAERVGTINYEIVSSLTSRVPKVYIGE